MQRMRIPRALWLALALAFLYGMALVAAQSDSGSGTADSDLYYDDYYEDEEEGGVDPYGNEEVGEVELTPAQMPLRYGYKKASGLTPSVEITTPLMDDDYLTLTVEVCMCMCMCMCVYVW
jgi:hypothetical protein